MGKEYLPPSKQERQVILEGVRKTDPQARVSSYQEAIRLTREQEAVAKASAVLYIDDRYLLINLIHRRLRNLTPVQTELLLLLGNQENPIPQEQVPGKLARPASEVTAAVHELQRAIETDQEDPRFLLTEGGLYLVPKLIIEGGVERKRKQQKRGQQKSYSPKEAAQLSGMQESEISELYSVWKLLEYGTHVSLRDNNLRITQQGLIRLRRLNRFRAQNPGTSYREMKKRGLIREIDPSYLDEIMYWQRRLEKALSDEEKERIRSLVQGIHQSKIVITTLQKIASFIFSREENPSQRQLDRTRMLLPLIKERATALGGDFLVG